MCGDYYERCTKQVRTDLDLSTTPLTNGCRNVDMILLRVLCSQSLFQFVQIIDAYFEHLLLQYSPTVCSLDLEFLSVTTEWQHVPDEPFNFHEVV